MLCLIWVMDSAQAAPHPAGSLIYMDAKGPMQPRIGHHCRPGLKRRQLVCAEEAVKKALELIPKYRYKDVLLYLDPPYVLSSRAGGLQYAKEMSDADHEKLLEVILDHPGPVVLSGYDSDLYRNMLKDWHRIELEGRTQCHARRTEVIWTNYIPPQAEQLTFELD